MKHLKEKGFLLVVSGPSGAGKGMIINGLLNRIDNLEFVVSWTTRQPRPNEVDDVHYKFVSKETFQEKVQAKGFLEWAIVYDQFYGTPMDSVENLISQGKIAVLEIDTQGARSIRTNPAINEVSIFVIPPDAETLAKRLTGRGTESEEYLKIRLKESIREVEEARYFDYIVINDEIKKAIEDAEMAVRGEFHRSRWVFDRIISGFKK